MKLNETKDTGSSRTTNYEGGEAFEPDDPRMALYKLTINNLLEDTYYRSDEEALAELRAAANAALDEDPEFVLKLAYYAREEMYLRDVPQVLLVLASQHDEAKEYVRDYAPLIIQRADEPMTVVATHDTLFGGTMSNALKDGVAASLHNFDEYQFAKYDSDRREVNLKDVMNRTHPVPQDDEEASIFERIIHGELDEGNTWKSHYEVGIARQRNTVDYLDTPETWETVISDRGNTEEAWRDVLPRMGLFARLRNLRNLREVGLTADEIFDEGDLEYATDSKIYPFRFYQAYKALQEAGLATRSTDEWLSAFIEETAEVLPDQLESTFVSVDLSGSMNSYLSRDGTMTYKEISAFLGAALMKQGAEASAFASDFVTVDAHSATPTLELTDKILSEGSSIGMATNGYKAIDYLSYGEKEMDRVILLTDMQIWDSHGRNGTVKSSFDSYREEVNPNASLYMIDLSSYGDLVTPEGYSNVYNISGWNEKIIDFIQYAEEPGQIIEEVENVNRA